MENQSKVIRNEFGTPIEVQNVKSRGPEQIGPARDANQPMLLNKKTSPKEIDLDVAAAKQRVASYQAAKENSKATALRRAEITGQNLYTSAQVNSGLKNAADIIDTAEDRHKSIFGVIGDVFSSNPDKKGNTKTLLVKQLQRAGYDVITNPSTQKQEVLYNGVAYDIDEIVDKPWYVALGNGIKNHAFELGSGIVTGLSYAKYLQTAAKLNPTKATPLGAAATVGMYTAGMIGDIGGSYLDAYLDKRKIERDKENQLTKDLLTDFSKVDEINTQMDDAGGLVVVFNKNAPKLNTAEQDLLNYTKSATENFMYYAGVNATNTALNDLAMAAVFEGVVRPAVKAAAHGLNNTKVGQTIKDHAVSTAIGTAAGTTAGTLAHLVVPGSGFVVGPGVGLITKAGLQTTKKFTKSAIDKGKDIATKNGVTKESLKGTIDKISPLKANTDIETWAYQTTHLNMKDPEALAAAQGLRNLGVDIPTDTGIGRVVNSMLLAPTSAPFIQNMVKNTPYTATTIRDMLQGFSHAFDLQLQKYLPANKNIAVSTLANDLRAAHANNINALNELANLGRQLTNGKRIDESFALDYWTAINKVGDGKQLTKIGLPSKYVPKKANKAAHLESSNSFEQLGAMSETQAMNQINTGILDNADLGDLLIMQANLSVIDKNLAATIPSLANLRINLDLAINDLLNSVADKSVREALRNNISTTMSKITAFEGLSTNKLLGKALREKDPDKMVQFLTDAIKEVSIIDSATGIKQILQVLPAQKRAPMEMLILKKVIEDFTENLESPGKAVINSAKLRGFLPKVKDQISTPEGKALVHILDLYAKSFGDSAAILNAAKPVNSVAGGQGISQSIMTRLHTRLVSTLTTKLLGWTTLTHAGQMFRASSLAAKLFKEPFSPKIIKAIDELYNAKVAEFNKGVNAKNVAAELNMLKDIKEAATHANHLKTIATNNADIIAKQVDSAMQSGKTRDEAIEEVLAQMGSEAPVKSEKQQLAAQGKYIVPTEKMTTLSNAKVADLQQLPAETVHNTEQAVKENILNYIQTISENYAGINQSFNQKNFANNIIDSYNQLLPKAHEHLKLSRFEEDFYQQLEEVIAKQDALRAQEAQHLAKQAEEEATKRAQEEAAQRAAKQAEEEAAQRAAKQAEEEAAQRAKIAEERKAEKKKQAKQEKQMKKLEEQTKNEPKAMFGEPKSTTEVFVGGSLRDKERHFKDAVENDYFKVTSKDIDAIIKDPYSFTYPTMWSMGDKVGNTVNPSIKTIKKYMNAFDTVVTAVEKRLADNPEQLAQWKVDAYTQAIGINSWQVPNKQILDRLVPYKTIEEFENAGLTIAPRVKTAYNNQSSSELLDILMHEPEAADTAFIMKNIDDVALAEVSKNVDLSKVMTRDGKPIIVYRGTDDINKFDDLKSYNANNFKDSKEADKYYAKNKNGNRIHDNSIWLSRDAAHALYFTKGENEDIEGGIRAFVLNKGNKLLNLHPKASFGKDSGHPAEFYSTDASYAHRAVKEMTPEMHKKYEAMIKQIREDKVTGVVFSDDTVAVFDASAINRIDSKPTNYTPKHEFFSMGGGILGVEQDENGQWQIDPVKLALGVLLGYGSMKAFDSQVVRNVSEALKYEPIIKRMLLLPQNEVPKYAKAMASKISKMTNDIANDKNIKYFYGGQRSKVGDLSKKQEAKRLWDKGYSNETIREKTGWEYNENTRQFRFEFDKEAKGFSDEDLAYANKLLEADHNTKVSLGKLFPNATELYKHYPELKEFSAVSDTTMKQGRGMYHPSQRTIITSTPTTRTIMTHEIQHAIQHIENYIDISPYLPTDSLYKIISKNSNIKRRIFDNITISTNYNAVDTIRKLIQNNKIGANPTNIYFENVEFTLDKSLPVSINSYDRSKRDVLPWGDNLTINIHDDENLIDIVRFIQLYQTTIDNVKKGKSLYTEPLFYYSRPIETEAYDVGGW